jgi:tetratricopeptide (TPR) repeat protein
MRIVLILLTAVTLVAADSDADLPLAAVIAAGDGTLTRAGDHYPLQLRAGDLLYAGDRVTSLSEAIRVASCSAGRIITAVGGVTLTVAASGVESDSGKPLEEPLSYCVLPSIRRDRRPVARSRSLAASHRSVEPAGDLASRIQKLAPGDREALAKELFPLDAAIRDQPDDNLARVSRAMVLERYGLHYDATLQYEEIRDRWPGVDWPRMLIHKSAEAARQPPPREKRDARTYFLAVGISEYLRLAREQSLEFADDDADLFADFYRSERGGKVKPDRIRILKDSKATSAAIRNSIDEFLELAGPDDTLILYFGAHGVVSDDGAFIVTHDSEPEDLRTTALAMEELQQLIHGTRGNVSRVLLFADVCRAGTIGVIRKNQINQVVRALLASNTTRRLGFLASSPGEYSWESERFGGGHGAFSYFVVKGLNGEADSDGDDDGLIDADELYEYVRSNVREATLRQQTPERTGDAPGVGFLIDDLSPDGIQLPGWQALDSKVVKIRSAEQSPSAERTSTRQFDLPTRLRTDLERFESALAAGRILPETPGSAFLALERLRARMQGEPEVLLALENQLRTALEDRGQEVLLRYLDGAREPQQRTNFQSGQLYFEAAMELSPHEGFLLSRALFCNGRVKVFDGDYDAALELLERAARIDPGGAYTYNALGLAFLEQGEFDRAAAAFRDAMRRAPKWIYPRHNLALTLSEQGIYREAVEEYRNAIGLMPDNYELPYGLALLYQRMNRRSEARASYQQAIGITADRPEAHTGLGYLYAGWRRPRRAEESYRRAIQHSPDYVPARHNLALLLSNDDRRASEATALWRQIIEEQPEFLPSRIGLASALLRTGREREAIQEYEEILRLQPERVSARLAIAEAYSKLDRLTDADWHLQEALRFSPNNALILERLGDTAVGLGDSGRGREHYEDALTRTSDPKSKKRIQRKLRSGSA